MTAIKTASALLAALLLGACTASPTAPAPVTPTPVRHVQSVDGDQTNGATFWGLNFDHETTDYVKVPIYYKGVYWSWEWQPRLNLQYSTTGSGDFKYLGNGRVRYIVPDGQALHITEIAGTSVNINGVSVGPSLTAKQVALSAYYQGAWSTNLSYVTAPDTEGRVTVDYVFGPGEVVMFAASPGSTLAGTVGDPSYFGGRSGGPQAK